MLGGNIHKGKSAEHKCIQHTLLYRYFQKPLSCLPKTLYVDSGGTRPTGNTTVPAALLHATNTIINHMERGACFKDLLTSIQDLLNLLRDAQSMSYHATQEGIPPKIYIALFLFSLIGFPLPRPGHSISIHSFNS